MNIEAPKRKRAPRKRKIVAHPADEIKNEANKVTDEINQRVDLNTIEMKMIHGSDNDKPTVERIAPSNDIKADVFQEIIRIISLSENAIDELQKSQKKLAFHIKVVRILFTIAVPFIAWNIYRLIQVFCR